MAGCRVRFLLQKWILENFKLVAVMESDAEPWFEDARVKTCATILRRCSNANERMSTSVKFVKFKRPLAQIIGVAPEQADLRFPAVDSLRDLIESVAADFEDPRMRIIVKRQKDLWEEGVPRARCSRRTASLDRRRVRMTTIPLQTMMGRRRKEGIGSSAAIPNT